MARATLRLPTARLRLPRLRLLDDDDLQMIGSVAVYTALMIWIICMLALAAGLAVRLFTVAAYG